MRNSLLIDDPNKKIVNHVFYIYIFCAFLHLQEVVFISLSLFLLPNLEI